MLAIPPDTDIRMFSENGTWNVSLARGERVHRIIEPGTVSAIMTFDPGVHWPDRDGQMLMHGVLALDDGAVVMSFCSLEDAMKCREKLRALRGTP